MSLATNGIAPAWTGQTQTAAPGGARPNSEVHQRIENQQDRIDQGVDSGQLTRGEYNHLEARLNHINDIRNADIAANGGHLTGQEKANLNAREDSLSNQIYFDKHNLAHQPGAPTI